MAYTVWKTLLESFPKSHFSTLIFEYANKDKDDSSHYEKLIEIVEESQKRNREKQEQTIEQLRLRLQENEARIKDKIDEQISERDKYVFDIEAIRKLCFKNFNKFVEEEQIR